MNNIDVGELLIQMLILCKTYNVKISIDIVDPNLLGPNVFSIRLERGDYVVSKLIDAYTMSKDSKHEIECIFRDALYELNRVYKEA